ncbi:MAG: hypothetical protein JST92_13225, partial [Deltaproteobacteria bacterium]|nr:hypothetical protein [Deltaproteobacteria bacterium]
MRKLIAAMLLVAACSATEPGGPPTPQLCVLDQSTLRVYDERGIGSVTPALTAGDQVGLRGPYAALLPAQGLVVASDVGTCAWLRCPEVRAFKAAQSGNTAPFAHWLGYFDGATHLPDDHAVLQWSGDAALFLSDAFLSRGATDPSDFRGQVWLPGRAIRSTVWDRARSLLYITSEDALNFTGELALEAWTLSPNDTVARTDQRVFAIDLTGHARGKGSLAL